MHLAASATRCNESSLASGQPAGAPTGSCTKSRTIHPPCESSGSTIAPTSTALAEQRSANASAARCGSSSRSTLVRRCEGGSRRLSALLVLAALNSALQLITTMGPLPSKQEAIPTGQEGLREQEGVTAATTAG